MKIENYPGWVVRDQFGHLWFSFAFPGSIEYEARRVPLPDDAFPLQQYGDTPTKVGITIKLFNHVK